MYVGKKYTETVEAAGKREFECTRCGHRQACIVIGSGAGAGNSAFFLDKEGAMARASSNATSAAAKDIDKTLALARCPSCHGRDRAAVRSHWLGIVFGLLAMVGMLGGLSAFMYADKHDPVAFWISGVIGAIALPIIASAMVRKWASIDSRVHWE